MTTVFCGLILGLLIFNIFGTFLIYYFVNRNWEKLLELQNYITNIDLETMRNTRQVDVDEVKDTILHHLKRMSIKRENKNVL